jgi:hypothetical protein
VKDAGFCEIECRLKIIAGINILLYGKMFLQKKPLSPTGRRPKHHCYVLACIAT